MYPSSLTFEMVEEITAMEEEIKLLKGSTQQENTVVNSVMLLRREIKFMKDTISWSPTESDLTISKVTIWRFLLCFCRPC